MKRPQNVVWDHLGPVENNRFLCHQCRKDLNLNFWSFLTVFGLLKFSGQKMKKKFFIPLGELYYLHFKHHLGLYDFGIGHAQYLSKP